MCGVDPVVGAPELNQAAQISELEETGGPWSDDPDTVLPGLYRALLVASEAAILASGYSERQHKVDAVEAICKEIRRLESCTQS